MMPNSWFLAAGPCASIVLLMTKAYGSVLRKPARTLLASSASRTNLGNWAKRRSRWVRELKQYTTS